MGRGPGTCAPVRTKSHRATAISTAMRANGQLLCGVGALFGRELFGMIFFTLKECLQRLRCVIAFGLNKRFA